MGSRGQPASPILESGQRPMAPTGMGGERWQVAEGTPLRLWERWGNRKSPRLKRMRAGRGGAGFDNLGPWTRISKQLIGRNADELWKRMEIGGRRLGSESPQALSPNSHSNRPPRPMEGRRRRFPQSGNRLPRANSAPKRPTKGAELWREVASEGLRLQLVAIPADRRTRRRAGRDGPRFSISHRSLGSAPIENPRAFSDSGRPPPSVGRVERAKRRTPAERRGELGGKGGGANNRPQWPIIGKSGDGEGAPPPTGETGVWQARFKSGNAFLSRKMIWATLLKNKR